jgi:hypothetical protein
MRLEFEGDERAQLARQLKLDPAVDDATLAAAVADKLGPEAPNSYWRDIDRLDAISDDYERRRRKRERYQAEVARQRREYTPSDADERLFELDDGSYPHDWLTEAEQSRVQAAQAKPKRRTYSIPGPGARPVPRSLRSSGAVHFGSRGVTTRPRGAW